MRLMIEDGLSRRTAAAWDELADATVVAPFLRPGWFEPWRRAFGAGQLVVFSAWRGEQLAAVVPFERRLRRLRAPVNWHTPFFGAVADSPEAELRVLAAALEHSPDQVDAGFVEAASPLESGFRSAAVSAGYRILDRVLERSPYVPTEGGWEQYLGGLARTFRSELRRRRRRLAETGAVELEVADGSARLDALLDEGLAVEAAGWKGERGTAISSQPYTEAFYRPMAHWAAERGWLRLAFLRVEGKPVAFDLGIEHDGVHYLLKTGYNPAFNPFSPGNLLREDMLSRSFSLGHRLYEFLGTNESWKLSWTGLSRERVLLQAFAPTVTGRARALAFARGRPLAKRIMARVRGAPS